MLYTLPSERKLGNTSYKYIIKSGRTLVAASIMAKMTHVPCIIEK